MKTSVKTLEGKAAGEIDLSDFVFAAPARPDLLQACVRYQLNKRRAGTHKVKVHCEVSGTGKKPYKQKGTGSARKGSLRATQFRGGGIVFGPHPRSHATDLPKRVRRLALRTALSTKLAEGKLIVLDSVAAKSAKTKDMVKTLATLGATNALFIVGAPNENFDRASRNIPHIDLLSTEGVNVYDILRRDTLVLTRDAVEQITARLTEEANG